MYSDIWIKSKSSTNHYLNTFLKKPGALKNSSALKCIPKLKSIYDLYFTTNPKYFIELLITFKDKEINEVVDELDKITYSKDFKCIDHNASKLTDDLLNVHTKNQISKINAIYKLNGGNYEGNNWLCTAFKITIFKE